MPVVVPFDSVQVGAFSLEDLALCGEIVKAVVGKEIYIPYVMGG